MKRKQYWGGFFSAFGIVILILDGQTAIKGMQIGVDFCLKSVIPSLFPFFILTNLMIQSLNGISISILSPLRKITSMPFGTECILISGFLGGYPVGAQSVASALHSGSLSDADAARLLGFCNNAGPAFLFGLVSSLFPHPIYAFALWGIHILGALFSSMLLPHTSPQISKPFTRKTNPSLTVALQSSIHVVAMVCGWIVVFRVIIAFLDRWILWRLPMAVNVLLTGMLELANGCYAMYQIPDISLRFVLCSIILAFGGVCVTLQTVSVTEGISLRFYLLGKALQTSFCFLLSFAVAYKSWIPFGILIFIAISFFWKSKNKGRNLCCVEI